MRGTFSESYDEFIADILLSIQHIKIQKSLGWRFRREGNASFDNFVVVVVGRSGWNSARDGNKRWKDCEHPNTYRFGQRADLNWRDKLYCKITVTIDYPPRRIWRSDASSFCAQIILWIQETARFANRTRAERDGTKDFEVIIPDPANPKESARRIALGAMPRMRSLN